VQSSNLQVLFNEFPLNQEAVSITWTGNIFHRAVLVYEKISFFGDSSNQKPPGSLFSQSLTVFD
jgi:hypothetical protein